MCVQLLIQYDIMKGKNIIISSLASCAILLASCNGGNSASSDTKFNPKERKSKFATDVEREAAIAQKRSELQIDIQTLLYTNDVKLSILPPAINTEDITENIVEQIALKMLEVTSQNGIGGINNVPGFALAASLNQTGREVTGTAPQMMAVQYTITYKVINTTSGDVYATVSQDIHGAGRSFEEATQNAVNDIKNGNDIQQMLKDGSEKIIAWYNNNLQTFKNQVEKAEGQQDYALALAYVETVPEKATEAFAYATSKQPALLSKFLHKIASAELNEMQTAITAANGEYSPEIGYHLSMIPTDAPEHKQAQALLDKYEKQVISKQTQEAEREAEASKRAHEKELMLIKADVKKAKYESEAIQKQNKDLMYAYQGFWGALGRRIIGGIDAVGDAKSDAAVDKDW